MKSTSYIYIAIFLFCLSTHSYGQDSIDVKYPYNIKLSYNGDLKLKNRINIADFYRIEFNYRFRNYLEAGIQFSYSQFLVIAKNPFDESVKRPRYGVGLKANFYPLELVFKNSPDWIQPYISGKVAYGHLFFDEDKFYVGERIPFDYGIYGGLNLYLGKYFGLYTEIGRSNLESGKNIDVNLGITVRF